MKKFVVTLLVICAVACSAGADEVTDWNRILFDAARVDKTSPLVLPRTAAITEASVFDAVNGIDRRYTSIHVRERGPREACVRAAAIQAAYAALVKSYPAQKSMFDKKRTDSLAALRHRCHHETSSVWAGIEWGQKVADAIWGWRSTDGFSQTPPPFEGGLGIGEWRPTPPAFVPGLLPQMASMETWVIQSHDQFRPPTGPPALYSEQYARDFNEVKQMGSLSSSSRSADQTRAAQFWGNTSAPAYFWNHVALTLLDPEEQSLSKNARLFALINIAMADAIIATWDTKYHYSSWRPVTAIALADQDGNAATAPDANWQPLLVTPPFPEYVSAHSSLSSAAVGILIRRFGNDTEFTVSSDVSDVTRHFTSISAALDEIRSARVNAGIHFRTACNEAQIMGTDVAEYVIDHGLVRLRDWRSDWSSEEDKD